MVVLPLASHSLEFGIHLLRGTPKLITSIVSSVIFTMLSTLFNLHAMRRGVLIAGPGAQSLAADFEPCLACWLVFSAWRASKEHA